MVKRSGSFECNTIREDFEDADAIMRSLDSNDSNQEKHGHTISGRSQHTIDSDGTGSRKAERWRSMTEEEKEAMKGVWKRHSNFNETSVEEVHMQELLVNEWQSASGRPSVYSRSSFASIGRSSFFEPENNGTDPHNETAPVPVDIAKAAANNRGSRGSTLIPNVASGLSGHFQGLKNSWSKNMGKIKSMSKTMSKGQSKRDKMKQEWAKEDQEAMDVIMKTYQDLPWIHTAKAQSFFGTVILVNAMCLALETDLHEADGFSWNETQDVIWLVVESVFLTLFIIELSLRLSADGLTTFRDPWNCLDLLLICTGFMDTWVLQVILAGAFDFFNASFLRIMRLLRLARIAKVFRFFRVLYLLIEGILNAMRMIVWFVMLLVLMLFVFGIFCTTTFGRDEAYPVNCFSSVPISMFTLFQLVTLEGWPGIYQEASKGHPAMWVFFILFIFVANMVMLNMMTGVIVENVLTIARDEEKDRDRLEMQKRSAAMIKLKRVFQLLDQDESGMLCREELEFLKEDADAQDQLKGLNIPTEQIMKLFDQMDFGGSGEISLEDFIDSCLHYSQGGIAERDLLQVQWDLRRHVQQSIRDEMQTFQAENKKHKQRWFEQLEQVLSETRRQVDLVVQHAGTLNREKSSKCQSRSLEQESGRPETVGQRRSRSEEIGASEQQSQTVNQQLDAPEEQSQPPSKITKVRSLL